MRPKHALMATASKPPVAKTVQAAPDRSRTLSGTPVEKVYTVDSVSDLAPAADLGEPGIFPYTCGIHADMYRGKLWTMRQFSGFATPEETNRRYRYLLDHGQTGLSVAFDLPTLMGYDADDPLASGEVGKCGVAISSLADMEELFRDIPLAEVTTSMTITSSAAIPLGDVPGRRREAGRGLGANLGHDPERHPQGVHGAKGVHLSAASVNAVGGRHARVRCRAHSAL